jgi:alpha-beta hydrolase superfamily lysophospholipase
MRGIPTPLQTKRFQVEEISTAIQYIRDSVTQSPNTPVVIMGHSTGCQDVMHYLCSPTSSKETAGPSGAAGAGARSWISGAVMQAPVSDREAILHSVNTEQKTKTAYDASMAIADQTPRDKYSTTILPTDVSKHIVGPAPINITRFLSLASPASPAHPSMDDYFSSDLSDHHLGRTFGRIGAATHFQSDRKHVLVLESGSDEAVPASIDKELLLSRWRKATEAGSDSATLSPDSLVVPHAKHDISGTSLDARTARLVDMRGAVLRYLQAMVGEVGGEKDDYTQTPQAAWAIWNRDRDEIEAERRVNGVKL